MLRQFFAQVIDVHRLLTPLVNTSKRQVNLAMVVRIARNKYIRITLLTCINKSILRLLNALRSDTF
jgi:hypothetical protein